MTSPLYIVDAFASSRFTGNPAGVCILTEEKDKDWMQSVAAEVNLSETAFVRRQGDIFRLKWFTPTTEVALCGHATLASAHILWETGVLPLGIPITFDTLSGKLTSTKTATWIHLDFPALAVKQAAPPDNVIAALGVHPIFTGRSRFDLLVEVATEEEVCSAAPDFLALSKAPDVRATILTSRSQSVEYDFISRFFAPSVGVDEDPVTGSAHCSLAPYWSKKIGRSDLTGYQASKRGGIVHTSLRGARVQLSGQAVTVINGCLL